MWPRRRLAALLAFAAVLLLLVVGRRAAEFFVEILWFRTLGLERVFWTQWQSLWLVRGVLALLLAAAVFGNLWVVSRTLGAIRVRRRFGNIEIAERLPFGYVLAVLAAIAALSGWWLSSGIGEPLAVRAALRHADWGVREPVFGRDISFYVFVLPLLAQLQVLAGVALFWIAMLVVASYTATGSLRMTEGKLHLVPHARRHLAALAAAALLVYAADLWLDRYGLMLSGSGVGEALGYTDVRARLPGLTLASVLTLLCGAGVGVGVWHGRRALALTSLAVLASGLLLARAAAPALVQKLVVEPDEFPREEPYLRQHLRFTRAAYGIADVERSSVPYAESTAPSASVALASLEGLPLWDPRPLNVAFNQRESLRRYFEFRSVQPDRYAGVQVATAVRELDAAQLPAAAQTWQNLHLRYLAGEGAVVSPAARMSEDGSPTYFLRDLNPPRLSPDAPAGIRLARPQVYFGEASHHYIVVDPSVPATGIPLRSGWTKLLAAWAFQSKNLLLSGSITERSRIVYRREIFQRVAAVAPWLRLLPDSGALPVLSDGRIVWMVDGYTTSDAYPLTPREALGDLPVRYARNSVKATVDALTGRVRLFALEPEEPILRTYAAMFPGLVRPMAEMPADLRAHLRYPAPLLALQARVLESYHLTDPRTFYAKEDVWGVAEEKFRDRLQPSDPLYATLPLPGVPRPEFLLSVPLVSQGRSNLAALLVARNDPPHYGELRLLEWPRDELVPGPAQVESRIDQDPEISQQLSLWKEGGSEVIRGHLAIVPVDSSILFVEPLYLEAERAAIPQLERVIVADSRRVVMRPTLEEAVRALLGEGSAPPARTGPPRAAERPAEDTPALLSRARQLLERAEAQLRAGDWAGFGRSWAELRALLARPAGPGAGR